MNPFYIALPYNDIDRNSTKAEARRVVPWFDQRYRGDGKAAAEGAMAGHQLQESDLLRPMGGLRALCHQRLGLCLRWRSPKESSTSRIWNKSFSGHSGLPQIEER
jgi:hypothetical protein